MALTGTAIEQTCKFCPEKLRFQIISAVVKEHPDGSKTMKMECQDTDGSVLQHYRDKHADKLMEPSSEVGPHGG